MSLLSVSSLATLLLSGLLRGALAEDVTPVYSACPLIGAYYPPPTVSKDSKFLEGFAADFTSVFDQLVKDGGSEDYGAITPNTTSFSVVLFGGTGARDDDPVLFEYHYTSPEDASVDGSKITADTKFPIADVTMVFTVYAWLVAMGDTWDTSITHFLPELSGEEGLFSVPWKDITIGSLAGHMSGLVRESYACTIGEACKWQAFQQNLAEAAPIFLPDTTPMVSYVAFELLAFAMTRNSAEGSDYSTLLKQTILAKLEMSNTGLLSDGLQDIFGIDHLNVSAHGEPAALSLVSTITDLARAGHAMLASKLLPRATTRRWLHPLVDTSNLRNGVGRPWEVYRAGAEPISPILDVLTKSGALGPYASYFGLVPDVNTGFAILAHDASVPAGQLDLNVYADVVSEALGLLQRAAAQETAQRYTGTFAAGGDDSVAVLNVTDNGPGLAVEELQISGVDLRAEAAGKLGIKATDLDFKLYPTTVQDEFRHQWVAVFQDMSAPVDMGTPTCITWQQVGAEAGVEYRFVFELDDEGGAARLSIPGLRVSLEREGS